MSFRERLEEEERNARFEEERRREREREHAPAYSPPEALVSGCPATLLMVVQVPRGTEGMVVGAVARHAMRGVTLTLWEGRPPRRRRRAMKLLFGRKLGKRLTG